MTRIEVVTLAALMALTGALVTPYVLRSREASRRQVCQHQTRILTLGLHQYHDIHRTLPAAAHWASNGMSSLALHATQRIDLVTFENWFQQLLPVLGETAISRTFDQSAPVGSPRNATARLMQPAASRCPSDNFNRVDNAYVFFPAGSEDDAARTASFARGNYAINGGTNNFDLTPPATDRPRGDSPHIVMDEARRSYQMWGNGIAGINKSFSLTDFINGQATLVAIEELRAGIDPADPRGTWSLGQIGASITFAHGVNGDDFGPNNRWIRADDVINGPLLNEKIGAEALVELGMPCVGYINANQQATSRSMHDGGVNVGFLDGSVRFINDDIDPGLWHVMHSRETPAESLGPSFEQMFAQGAVVEPAVPSQGRDFSPAPHSARGERFTNSVGMEFVMVRAGSFVMGLPDVRRGVRNPTECPPECPPHEVRITRPFAMSVCEVTQEQFATVMDQSRAVNHSVPVETAPRATNGTDGRLPVTGVTWNAAMQFCNELSALPEETEAGRRYRVPTEAEWEYACRAGNREPHPWSGSRQLGDSSGEAAGIVPPLPLKPVGSYPPNAFGLHDMRGNAWEWTSDWFERAYYGRSPHDNPQGPVAGFIKVVRGGDWRFVGEPCHIDYPMLPPWKSSPVVGIRVVCEEGLVSDDAPGS